MFFGLALQTLNLAYNRIVDIEPQIFSGLSMLESLHLDNNRLIVLQRNVFASLEYLKKLTLNNNQLVLITQGSLSGIFDTKNQLLFYYLIIFLIGLKNLDYLSLYENRIYTLDDFALSPLIKLTDLYLQKNFLIKIRKSDFIGMSNLRILNLESNNIVFLDLNSLVGNGNLKKVCIFKNPILTFLGSLEALENLCTNRNNPNCKVILTTTCQ